MALSLAARSRWILAVLLLAGIAAAGAWRMRQRPPHYPLAYVGDRTATLWSTTAQVRQPMATLHYGERVAVLRRSSDQAEVRTNAGARGWIDTRLLMDSALWQSSAELLRRAQAMPVEASGKTRTLSNVHLAPARDASRIFQFGRDVPVAVLERRATAIPRSDDTVDENNAASPSSGAKKEDWLLVLRELPGAGGFGAASGSASNASSAPSPFSASPASPAAAGTPDVVADAPDTPMAGWVLARFIELTPPQPIPDYSSAAGMRVVAWVVLNTVADAGGEKPQYLVAGTRGGEGHACDFTLLRAYTWGAARQRYETAYVEDGLCGQLPIRVRQADGSVEFTFAEADQPGVDRVYRMKQTIIRRITEGAPVGRKRR